MNKSEITLLKIILSAQKSANKAVQDLIAERNADKFPEMMPTDFEKERTFNVELIATAISEYHNFLQSELQKLGLELPNISER